MDDNTSLNRTDRILRTLIWLGLGIFALFIIDMLYLDNALLNKLFSG